MFHQSGNMYGQSPFTKARVLNTERQCRVVLEVLTEPLLLPSEHGWVLEVMRPEEPYFPSHSFYLSQNVHVTNFSVPRGIKD